MITASRCPRCQADSPSGARFCSSCAQPLTADALEYPQSALESAVSGARRLLLPALVFTVAVLGVVVMVLAARLENLTRRAAAAPPPSAPAPVIASSMPADVSGYLRFLAGIEQRRVALMHEKTAVNTPPASTGSAAYTPPPADPAAAWFALVSDFHTSPIPEPCNPLAAEYGGLLNATSSGNDTASIDVVAARADGELDRLTQSYGAPKPFKIEDK